MRNTVTGSSNPYSLSVQEKTMDKCWSAKVVNRKHQMVDLSPITTVEQQAVKYLYSLPDEVMRGNVFAIVIFLFLFYIAVYLIQKFTTLMVFVLKKVFLLIIVALAFYEFVRVFAFKIALEGITADTIIFGALGAVIGMIALFIALYVALHSIIRLQREPAAGEEQTLTTGERAPAPAPPAEAEAESLQKEMIATKEPAPESSLSTSVKEELSFANLRSDKRIGAVIAYIVIAEFGVFSSKTIAAPTIEAGLMFFVVFLLASVVFIRLTYHDYWRGLRHLAAALVIGSALSVILGYFWGGIPLDQLLSLSYFTTDALVALITGLALSLFMGSIS
jgi:hypothetical protein